MVRMISIDPSTNTERENYKLLIGSIVPRPIAFVTTISNDGTLNGAPFSYFNIVSSNPPMISLSIQRNGRKKKIQHATFLKQKSLSFTSLMNKMLKRSIRRLPIYQLTKVKYQWQALLLSPAQKLLCLVLKKRKSAWNVRLNTSCI